MPHIALRALPVEHEQTPNASERPPAASGPERSPIVDGSPSGYAKSFRFKGLAVHGAGGHASIEGVVLGPGSPRGLTFPEHPPR